MNALVTTVIILIASIVFGTGIVLYGMTMFDSPISKTGNKTIQENTKNDNFTMSRLVLGNSTHYVLMQEKNSKPVFFVTANNDWTQVEKVCEINQWCYLHNNNTIQIINSSIIITGVKSK